MINGVHLFWSWEGGMSAEAQGAAGSQQLSLGVDVERLQKQHDIASDLPADNAEGHHRARPQVFHFHPPPWKNENRTVFSHCCETYVSEAKTSDELFRHLFRQITISPSKENLFWAKTALLLRCAIPLFLGFAAALDSPEWLRWDQCCTHHWWWIITRLLLCVYTLPRCVGPEDFTGWPPELVSTWSTASFITRFSRNGRWILHAPQVYCQIPVSSNSLSITTEADK